MENQEDTNLKRNGNTDKNININSKPKNKISKKLVIIGILILVICIAITSVLIFLKIRAINNKYNDEVDNEDKFIYTDNRKEDPDLKYVCSDDDKYNFNDIEFKQYVDVNGVLYSAHDMSIPYTDIKTYIEYIEISGLKNKDIQNKINEEIKNVAYSKNEPNEDGLVMTYCSIEGNFSNVLSIKISNNAKNTGLNYDLNIGNKIPFEDLFIKSTPIASIMADMAYYTLALNIQVDYTEDEDYFEKFKEASDMNNRDTSEYEDTFIKIAKEYNSKKGNIDYVISENEFQTFNIDVPGISEGAYTLNCELYKYKDYIAIYKRYLGGDLYENQNVRLHGVKVFTVPSSYDFGSLAKDTIYGDYSDNYFVDVTLLNYDFNNDNYNEKVRSKAKELANEIVDEIKKEADSDKSKGYVLQGCYAIINEPEPRYDYDTGATIIPHIEVNYTYDITTMSMSLYNNLNYYLQYLSCSPKSAPGPIMFNGEMKPYQGMQSTMKDCTWYFDLDGNYLGTDNASIVEELQTETQS